jgi:hypothetical protein
MPGSGFFQERNPLFFHQVSEERQDLMRHSMLK